MEPGVGQGKGSLRGQQEGTLKEERRRAKGDGAQNPGDERDKREPVGSRAAYDMDPVN